MTNTLNMPHKTFIITGRSPGTSLSVFSFNFFLAMSVYLSNMMIFLFDRETDIKYQKFLHLLCRLLITLTLTCLFLLQMFFIMMAFSTNSVFSRLPVKMIRTNLCDDNIKYVSNI